ncbi:MAG TPA: hypothetical protein VG602_00890 [Actinomycetota bacterium]|nr:hypothetical protein [Actinomycetota bacterium]
MTALPARARLEVLLRLIVALLSLGAAAVHTFVIQSHFAEYWLFGVFFLVLALLQAVWAVTLMVRPIRRLLIWGAVGNAIVVGLWLVTRTVGLPLGPEPGSPEAVGFIDGAATAFEVLLVAGVWALLRPGLAGRSIPREFVPAGAIGAGVMIAMVTQDAVLSGHGTAEGIDTSSILSGHVPHLILIGIAVAAFVGYVVVDVLRHGRPTFSKNARLR